MSDREAERLRYEMNEWARASHQRDKVITELRATIATLRAQVSAAEAVVQVARSMHDQPCVRDYPDPDVTCSCKQWDGYKQTHVDVDEMRQLHAALEAYDKTR